MPRPNTASRLTASAVPSDTSAMVNVPRTSRARAATVAAPISTMAITHIHE